MSQVRAYSLLGDSNIRRHITKTTCRASASVKGAQIISCGAIEILAESLKSVRPTSNVVILSCMTNFITSSAEGPAAVSQRVGSVLQDIRDVLVEACEANPSRQHVVSPPMYRTAPVWYRDGLPEILMLFSQSLITEKPANLHILPSFSTPEFEADGVHLTIYSALQFVLHLFDSAQELLDNLSSSTSEVATRNSETTRVLEDRVMVLEQDHRRLNRVLEHKIAIDSELADFHANERTEDFFVISGLRAIEAELVGKDWQVRAIGDVQDFIKKLMGREMPVLFVKNSTKRHKDAEVTYTVRMRELSDCRAIRDKFGSFYIGGGKPPQDLKHFSVKNFVTPETNTRISVLKLIAQKYHEANKGSKVQVIGYQPRPVIKITPASSASDRRVKTYNYVEAVTKLSIRFSSAEVEPILKRINSDLVGKIRSIFIVLSDDAFKKLIKSRAPRQQRAQPSEAQPPEAEADAETEVTDPEVESNADVSDKGSTSSSSGRNSRKRGASSSAEDRAAKK